MEYGQMKKIVLTVFKVGNQILDCLSLAALVLAGAAFLYHGYTHQWVGLIISGIILLLCIGVSILQEIVKLNERFEQPIEIDVKVDVAPGIYVEGFDPVIKAEASTDGIDWVDVTPDKE